jgi:hypothetical protein
MPDHIQPDSTLAVWDGFGAALIHDIGKVGELTTFAEKKRREGHELSHTRDLPLMLEATFEKHSIPWPPRFPASWFSVIIPPKGEATGTIPAALKLADQISKQIQGEYYSRLEDENEWLAELEKTNKPARERLRRHNLPTEFHPFFGSPKKWEAKDADPVFLQICRELGNEITMSSLMGIQELVRDFPHTRYVPHLSLKLHDQFAAALFYFVYRLYREAGGPPKVTEFEFFSFEVSPDLLDVFYRLRDVLACSRQAEDFYQHVFAHLFSSWEADLPGITAQHNPFVFYQGQGFVFLYPKYDDARAGLEKALAEVPLLRKIEVRCTRFVVELKNEGGRRRPGAARAESFEESLPAPSLADFASEGGERCQGCYRTVPVAQLAEDNKGDLLCEACRLNRRQGSGVDLDAVSKAGNSSNRIGYLFVTLPNKLRAHAAQVAEQKLIPAFWPKDDGLEKYCPPATEQHVYEYLQALTAIKDFDAALEEGVKVIRLEKGQNASHTLFKNPSGKAIVVHEDYFWELLEFIHGQKQKLRLECSVRAVVCPPKTPFWSLVELATQHEPSDILWDVSKGAIHMFSDTEINGTNGIRRLASDAKKYGIWRAQLNALSAVALQTSLEELILEIDNRTDRLKELREPIKTAVRALGSEGSSLKNQEKRAVFFKYIAGLTR